MARILFVAIAVVAALLIGARTSHAQTSGWLERSIDRDDAVFDDFTAGFNGMVLGGVGALAGGIVGAVAN